MRFEKWWLSAQLGLMLAVAVMLVACGGGGGTSTSVVTVDNTSPAPLDLQPRYPETGFTTTNAFPRKGVDYTQVGIPNIGMVESASKYTVFIFMPGVADFQQLGDCSDSQIPVPLRNYQVSHPVDNILIYFFCSNVVSGGNVNSPAGFMQYIEGRVTQFKAIVAEMTAAGVLPENIYLAGHSAGAWSALSAAFQLDRSTYGGVVAFAPAFAGQVTQRSNVGKEVIEATIADLVARASIHALVFAYDDDTYEATASALMQTIKSRVTNFHNYNCGQGHFSDYFPAYFSDQTCDAQTQDASSQIDQFVVLPAAAAAIAP